MPRPAAPTLQTQINRMGQPKRKEACREGHSCRQKQGHRVEGGRKSCLGCWCWRSSSGFRAGSDRRPFSHLPPPPPRAFLARGIIIALVAGLALGMPEATIGQMLVGQAASRTTPSFTHSLVSGKEHLH